MGHPRLIGGNVRDKAGRQIAGRHRQGGQRGGAGEGRRHQGDRVLGGTPRREGREPVATPEGTVFDESRHRAAAVFAVTELTQITVAPRGQAAIRTQRQTVGKARHHRGDGPAHQDSGSGDVNRGHDTGGAPVADLAGAVVAPGEDAAVGTQREAVRNARRDGGDRFSGQCPGGGDRNRDITRHRRAVAELAVSVVTPCRERTIGAEREGEFPPSGDRGDRFAGQHALRLDGPRQRAGHPAIAQLVV